MAGIFGVQHWGADHNVEIDIGVLLNVARQGFDHPALWHRFEAAGVGSTIPPHYSNTNWPLVTRDGQYALAVFGEIYLADGTPLREANYEDRFIRPFLASPETFLLSLDGVFCFALMSTAQCLIVSDPFGSFALHYIQTKDRFLFASQMEGLRRLTNDQSQDETGILQSLGLGMTLASRTTFSNISRLAGGTILAASKEGIRTQTYFKPSYHAKPKEVKPLLEQVRTDFERSVLRRADYPNVGAALTGGFDSRATWSVLLKHHIPIRSHTHGLPNCSDLKISKRIADAFDIPQDNVIFDEQFLRTIPDRWQTFVRLSEGGITIAHAPTLLMWEHLKSRFSVLLDSYGGTFYRRQRMNVAERIINPKIDLIPQILRFERSPLVRSNLLKPEARRAIENASDIALRTYYDSISGAPLLGDKFDMFHFDQVDAMRDALLSNVQMNFVGVAHPFLNLSAINAATSLPLSERKRNAAHKNIVHASFPRLERFWMDNVGFPTPYRGFSTLRFGPMVAEKGLRKMGRIFPKPFSTISLRKPTMDLAHLLRPGLRFAKELLLTPHVLFDPLIDRVAIEEQLLQMENDRFDSGDAMVQLLTFRIFLDLFF